MRRREFISLVGAAAATWPLATRSQPVRIRHIGILWGASASDPELHHRVEALKQALRNFGWTDVEIAFELRCAEGKLGRLPELAAELVNDNVDVIVTNGTEPAVAARNATGKIHIVVAVIGDAIGAGLASSLARPGGNVTGLTLVQTNQGTKRLQLIKEVLPNLVRAAVFFNPHNASIALQRKNIEVAASTPGLQLHSFPIGDSSELDATFDAVLRANVQAIVTLEDQLILFLRERIIELAMHHMVPVMGEFGPMASAGALMSYSANLVDMWRSAARYVDEILKGANPADLPIEEPSRFELVINLKTAKALGLTISNQLQLLADEVIE
jgi:putative ABC transport system substrate-binding protein